MVNIFALVISTLVITIVGGGAGYWLWLKTRPKKEIWSADVYQLGDGIKPPIYDEKQNLISDLKLRDLKPYCLDTLEKVEKEHGIIIFRLNGLKTTTGEVTADTVDIWGGGKKRVTVLLHNGSATLLKKGYDNDTGNVVFQPLPFSRINTIRSQIALRKDRHKEEKDVLVALTPWVVTIVCMIFLFGIAYLNIQGQMDLSKQNTETQKYASNQAQYTMDNTKNLMVLWNNIIPPDIRPAGIQANAPPNQSVVTVPNI